MEFIFNNIAVPLLVAVVSVILTAYITIKIKFASDEESAISGLKRALSNGGLLLLNLFIGLHLVLQVTSEDPLTRKAVFVIVVDSLVLFLWLVSHFFHRILGILDRMMALHSKQVELLNATAPKIKNDSVENGPS